ncbi:MAG: 23S rRNA (pseudouridine(1915)-N(3))-methyltransferase RlmH [Bacteroidia bacterium]|nr:23S rRNA (pseudouridine(1915)-N(3))-methyltransferase RlmH [Bacteroidia bacterium]
MKIKFICINKTRSGWIRDGMDEYLQRLRRYITVELKEVEVNNSAKKGKADLVLEEAQKVLGCMKAGDHLVLLDEKGKMQDSEAFAQWLNRKFVTIQGDLVFVVGGAYGFHDVLKEKSVEMISLSKMTFTHQMVRVVFIEQVYRAMTILNNEPYHHS